MDGASDRCHRTPLFARDTGLLHTLLTLETSEEVAGPLKVEDNAGRGPLDMAVRFSGRVYVFELKVVEQAGPGVALAQLKARGYADKYRARGESIYLVGVEFSRESRNVTAFDTEAA